MDHLTESLAILIEIQKHGKIDLALAALRSIATSHDLDKLLETSPIELCAEDVCAILGSIGIIYPLPLIQSWNQEQLREAANYAERRALRNADPVDVPARPSFFP